MKKLSVIVVLILLGFLADYLFLHKLFPLKQQAALKELNAEVTKVLNRDPNSPGNFPAGTSTENSQVATYRNNFAEEYAKCFDSNNEPVPNTSDELLQQLRSKNLVKLETALLTNIHVKTTNGEIRRIHLIADSSAEHAKISEVRLFSEDKEGLPVPIPLPPTKAKNPKPEYLQELQKLGDVVLTNQKKHMALNDGTQILFETVNSVTQDFQWLLKSGSFNCHSTECLCRK